MITIKIDRGWENPKTWDAVESLPGYVKDVDPSTAKLNSVIGKYREPEFRVCGLSNCHTKHYRGYLATTTDGRITNIGVDCGKKHFGVDFETMSRQLDRDWQNQERRETLTAGLNKVEGWQKKCEFLLNSEHSASWLYKQYRLINSADGGLPKRVINILRDMMKKGTNVLIIEREATQREKEIAVEMGQQIPIAISDEVGLVKGLSGLNRIDELRDILAKDLEPNLNAFATINVEDMKEQDLRYWSKWCGEVESKLNTAAAIIEDATQFFSRENILQLGEVVDGRDDEKVVMTIAKYY